MTKKLFLVLATFCALSMIACNKIDNQAAEIAKPISVTVIEEEIPSPPELYDASITTALNDPIDNTAELKTKSYEALKGYTEADFYDGEFFDIAAFAHKAGCSCVLSSNLDEIIIHPNGYNAEEDFEVVIKISPLTQMVSGDTISLGRIDGGWSEIENHYSATDFTAGMMVDSYAVQVGFDELDYLWRQIRVLTAPDDKFNEINAEIDAEIESYYEFDETLEG